MGITTVSQPNNIELMYHFCPSVVENTLIVVVSIGKHNKIDQTTEGDNHLSSEKVSVFVTSVILDTVSEMTRAINDKLSSTKSTRNLNNCC